VRRFVEGVRVLIENEGRPGMAELLSDFHGTPTLLDEQ
jgi:hypothetical protein